uniref:Uncharacterized protein n=1 Tax=Asparagus officinalis TaxID=4686 RepID=Q2XNY6_ASPOF|nr:hypothetical protein 10.t00029 [Asparagus officinalis]
MGVLSIFNTKAIQNTDIFLSVSIKETLLQLPKCARSQQAITPGLVANPHPLHIKQLGKLIKSSMQTVTERHCRHIKLLIGPLAQLGTNRQTNEATRLTNRTQATKYVHSRAGSSQVFEESGFTAKSGIRLTAKSGIKSESGSTESRTEPKGGKQQKTKHPEGLGNQVTEAAHRATKVARWPSHQVVARPSHLSGSVAEPPWGVGNFGERRSPAGLETWNLKKIETLGLRGLTPSDLVLGDHQRQIRQVFERIRSQIYAGILRI